MKQYYDKPRAQMSAYSFFSQEFRSHLIKTLRDQGKKPMNPKKIAELQKREWNRIRDDPKRKAKYDYFFIKDHELV